MSTKFQSLPKFSCVKIRQVVCLLTFQHLLLGIAFIQGLMYSTLIPPWWNYDEPRHFWLAWTLTRGEIREEDKQRLVSSLLEYDWFHHYPRSVWPTEQDYDRYPPVLTPSSRPKNRLLYWYFVSLPLRVLSSSVDMAWQLRIMRWFSVSLFVATIYFIWRVSQLLFGQAHPLSRILPLFMVLLPGFAEPMSLLNDDTGAAFAGMLFLWAGLLLLKKGINWKRLLFFFVAVWVAQGTKRTAIPLLATIPFVLLFSLPWKPRYRWVPWIVFGIGVGLALGLTFGWGDPAYWYEHPPSSEPLRITSEKAQDGRWILRVPPNTEIGQWIPYYLYNDYKPGTPLYLSLWIWADHPGDIALPQLCTNEEGFSHPPEVCTSKIVIPLSREPQYYVIPLPVLKGSFGRIEFKHTNPRVGMVYLDALTLSDRPPANANQEMVNLLRNGSAEKGRFRIQPWVQKALPAGNISLSVALTAWQDWSGAGLALRKILSSLFRTYWGYFARAKIPYWGERNTYLMLFLVSLVGVGGFLWGGIRYKNHISKAVATFLSMVLFLVWIMTISFPLGRLHFLADLLTWSRYAFAGIYPLSLVLVVGWYIFLKRWGRPVWIVRFLWWLNLLAWWSIALFFYPDIVNNLLPAILLLFFCFLCWKAGPFVFDRWLP